MNKLWIACFATLLASGLCAQAQTNDSWEPNNSAGGAVPWPNTLIGSSGTFAGFEFQYGPPAGGPNGQTREIAQDLIILPADEDWFQVTAPIDGVMTVYMNQINFTEQPSSFRLVLQILNQAGSLVFAGPNSGTYSQLNVNSPTPDAYNGARAQTNVTQGTIYNVKVFYPIGGLPLPTTAAIRYQLSVEFGNPDPSEGTYGNQFPGYRPKTGLGQEADATPTAPGAANARVLTNRSYNGYDYYMVQLNQPASITFQIENIQPLGPNFNFDVYWVRTDGALLSETLVNPISGAMQGAEDSFPNGWDPLGPMVVNTPRATETLITPPLVPAPSTPPASGPIPGTYYFHVVCWQLSATTGITLTRVGGTYTVRVILTSQSDDTLEGVGLNQNDTADKAMSLPVGTTNNLRLLNDPEGFEEDWYKVRVNNGESLEVRMVVTQPATDDLNIRLYKPNPDPMKAGGPADLIDFSTIPNHDAQTKGAATPREIVGTWGTVGVNGNSQLPDGDFLIRITQGNLLHQCGYSLIVTIPTPFLVAPEDAFEPNNNWATVSAVNSTYLELQPGLTKGLKCMDQEDWFKFKARRSDNVQVTMRYDAGPDVDLDLLMYDLNGGPNAVTDNVPEFLGAPNFTVENAPGMNVVVQATAGTTWIAGGKIAPQTGFIYVQVRRWGTRASRYELNINVNNGTPIPPLVADQIQVTNATIAVPNSTDVVVAIRNQGAFDASLADLNLRLTHSSGANVTAEYTITFNGSSPLPEIIPAAQTNLYPFNVTSTASSTSGTVYVTIEGLTGTGLQLVGSPRTQFVLTGGLPPAPKLIYSGVEVTGTLAPSGVAFVRATVRNEGTQGGFYEDNVVSFNFSQSSANVTNSFIRSPDNTAPQLPTIIGAGNTVEVVFVFTIRQTVGLGDTTVTVAAGGPQNPVNPGIGTFLMEPQFSTQKRPDSAECGVAAGAPLAPPASALLLAGVALLRRRRRS